MILLNKTVRKGKHEKCVKQ